ncbi:hypothetical protein [Enterococcus sp. AZ109]
MLPVNKVTILNLITNHGYRNPTGAVALLNIELFESFIKRNELSR